jgi:hypothetical protein
MRIPFAKAERNNKTNGFDISEMSQKESKGHPLRINVAAVLFT